MNGNLDGDHMIKKVMKEIIHDDFFQGVITSIVIITIFIELIIWQYGC